MGWHLALALCEGRRRTERGTVNFLGQHLVADHSPFLQFFLVFFSDFECFLSFKLAFFKILDVVFEVDIDRITPSAPGMQPPPDKLIALLQLKLIYHEALKLLHPFATPGILHEHCLPRM